MYTVYSKPACRACDQTKALLKELDLPFSEIILDVNQQKLDGVKYITRSELLVLIPNAKSMPQIMINNDIVGGLYELKKVLGR